MADVPRADRRSELPGNPAGDYSLVVLGPEDEVPPGFLLGPSRLTLGAGEKDDVYLTGVGVVPAHVQLIFLEGRVTLLSATEEIRVDGKTVTGFPCDLQPLQTLSLSPDTHLSFGVVGSAWPAPPVWERPDAAGEASVTEGRAAPKPEVAESPALRRKLSAKEHTLRLVRHSSIAVGSALLIICGIVAIDQLWGGREVVVSGGVAIDRSRESLNRLLASDTKSFGSVKMNVRPDGALALTGFLDSEEAYRRLAEQVRQQVVESGGNVRLDATTTERLSGLVRDQLSRHPLGSRIEVTPTDVRVTVFGAEPEPVVLERLKSDLARLSVRVMPRRLAVDFNLEPSEDFAKEITGVLAGSPSTRDMQFKMDSQGGKISGMVAGAVESAARQVLADLEKRFADRLPLTVDLKVDPKLNFSVVSLVLGGNASTATLMQKGKVQTFRVGEPVFGTGELADIKGDGVVLALGRREIFIPLIR